MIHFLIVNILIYGLCKDKSYKDIWVKYQLLNQSKGCKSQVCSVEVNVLVFSLWNVAWELFSDLKILLKGF